ncbi:MAG: efflux RND transporter periplasmic adaptor subunit [Actinomycetia bacterium]|nr:efflux RND transporter periplasmic adaptor subunit [Actinomycetes bacterium]
MSISKRLRRYRGWIALVALVAVGAAVYLLTRPASNAGTATTYTTEAATRGTLSVTVSGTGNLAVDNTTEVYPSVSGTVASVKVAKGDKVATGDVLFTLDAQNARANTAKALAGYRQSQQGVAQASANLVKTKNNLANLQERANEPSNTVTSADIAAAQADVTAASASLTSAKASQASSALDYEQTKASQSDLVVKAPASGVIYSIDIAAGDTVSASSGGSSSAGSNVAPAMGVSTTAASSSSSSNAPIVIAPAQPLSVLLAINEVDLPSLKIGQRADIEFDALPDLTSTGKVYDIADTGTNSSGVVTFDVRLSLDVADPALRAGMSSAATIVTGVAKDAIIVPSAAVKLNTDGTSYVQVLDPSGTPRKVTVEVGLSSSTQAQILSGVTEGEKVVTSSSATSGTSTGGGFSMPGFGGGPRG